MGHVPRGVLGVCGGEEGVRSVTQLNLAKTPVCFGYALLLHTPVHVLLTAYKLAEHISVYTQTATLYTMQQKH